ncbi:MAG: ribonuclease P [Candidatus Heimdallarchaeota archaeon]|jgi:ribonuclease P protein subunit RPR2|nr:ribonuclease P [Candidatus Heimdallarchaeota archaeon]
MQSSKQKNSSRRKKRSRKRKSLALSPDEVKDKVVWLLEEANRLILEDYELAQEYASRAQKIQMRTRIKFPSQWKKRFCKHCKIFLYPGVNCQVRLSSTNKVIAIKCSKCNGYTRIPYYHRTEE